MKLTARRAALPVALSLAALFAAGQALSLSPVVRAQGQNPGAKADGTARQTARPWNGSPLGPGNAFEYDGRAQVLRIAQVMNDLKIGPGSSVADIGAGGGWLTMLAAQRVGREGRVYAEDILPRYTRFIAQRARRAGLRNVTTIVGTTTDPKLPPDTMDAVLILNAYHEFEQPLAVLKKVSLGMKKGARLAFIERDDDQLRQEAAASIAATGQPKRRVDERPDGNEYTDDHRLALPIVEREAAQAGFAKLKAYDLGQDHYVLIVEKK